MALGVGLVGLGWWGKELASLAAGSAAMDLVSATDTDPGAAEWAAEHRIDLAVDLASMLGDPRVEAVILATPNGSHHQQTLQAARAGKHVFCEKPLALERRDALEMVDACAAADLVLGLGYERRFEPPTQRLFQHVERGDLGQLVHFEGLISQDRFVSLARDNWRFSNSQAPAGPLTAVGVHLIDLSIAFLGPADSISAQVRNVSGLFPNGDSVSALITYDCGATATITALLSSPAAGRFAVHGRKGWAEVVSSAHLEAADATWTLTTSVAGRRETAVYPAQGAVLANLEAFAAAIAGGAPYPISADEMVDGVALTEGLVDSVTEERWIWPEKAAA